MNIFRHIRIVLICKYEEAHFWSSLNRGMYSMKLHYDGLDQLYFCETVPTLLFFFLVSFSQFNSSFTALAEHRKPYALAMSEY